MVLYMVGLGLGDERDVTIKGKEAIESSEIVFLEAYTSVLGVDASRLVRAHCHHLSAALPPASLLRPHAKSWQARHAIAYYYVCALLNYAAVVQQALAAAPASVSLVAALRRRSCTESPWSLRIGSWWSPRRTAF